MNEKQNPSSQPRREFLKSASAIGAFMILPSGTRLAPLNSKLRTAHIGVGGMGNSDLNSIASHKMVEVAALCDVDSNRMKGPAGKFKEAKTFKDFRELLSEMGDKVDAVVVSTPDHTHATAAMSAMNVGKHVYCQKPLTHEIYESRQLAKVAKEKKLVTQMGIQIHSKAVYRKAARIVRSGKLGKIAEVHAWSNKNWGYDGEPYEGKAEVPENLDWNLWLGPAPERDYVPKVYHPGNWRKIIDFGTGTLGDMGVHIFDTPFDALNLKIRSPNWVKTTCRKPTGFGHPEKNTVEYEFPGTSYTTKTLKWMWYDGRNSVPKPTQFKLPLGVRFPGQASFFVGTEGMMLLPHIGEPVLFPETKFSKYKKPHVVDRNHYHQWVNACLGKGTTGAPFSFGGPLTEALLMGVVANRFPGEVLKWDAKKFEFVRNEEANKLIKRKYRKEFEVKNLS